MEQARKWQRCIYVHREAERERKENAYEAKADKKNAEGTGKSNREQENRLFVRHNIFQTHFFLTSVSITLPPLETCTHPPIE